MSQANRRSLWTFTVLLALTLAAAAALSIWGREEAAPASSAVSVPASANWGLSFQNEGQAPAGNASREDLAKYGAYFLGDTSKKVLYLTFDCGYENGYTGQILDALKKHNAPAAFFIVGHYLESSPDLVLTTAEFAATGVDETSGILLKNSAGQMAVIALTLRAKQPKRGVIAGEKGFIEICEYPRAQRATITYTESGRTEVIEEGESSRALDYEVLDMQEYVRTGGGGENLRMVRDVMEILTAVRSRWGMVYPFE